MFVSALLVSLTLCCSAEVRLMNGTDQPLVVDVGPSKGVALPVGSALSDVVGSKLGKNESELLIVRSTDGAELYREEVQTDNIVVINPHGNRLIQSTTKVGGLYLLKNDGKPTVETLR